MPTDNERTDPSSQDHKEPLPNGDSVAAEQDGSVSPETVAEPPVYSHADDPYGTYGTYDDPYGYQPQPEPEPVIAAPAEATVARTETPPPPPPPSTAAAEEPEDDDDDGMLRMSFMEHLDELRKRLLLGLAGLGVAFLASLSFSERLWKVVQEPADAALKGLGYTDASLVYTSPMEGFSIIWVKLPLVVGLFLASPWLLYQVWAFVAPGLYKRERRFAGPFIVCSAGLFIAGGLFAYFVAFRFGLAFLLGIGKDVGVRPMITITDYFDIFVNVILGIAVVFELPVLIFFLTLLRIASPQFLIRNARYAVLGIVALAAVITPTPDVVNLMLFSVPMVLLYFVGVFASYLLVPSREDKRIPWGVFLLVIGAMLLIAAGGVYVAISRFGYKLIDYWPFLTR